MGAPSGLLVRTLASTLDFSHCHSTKLQSGAPPCAASNLLSWLKITLLISCKHPFLSATVCEIDVFWLANGRRPHTFPPISTDDSTLRLLRVCRS